MCGIAGVYFFNGSSPSENVLRQFVRTLSHRGPDQANVSVSGRTGLAHTRLKIIDLSDAAAQPMQDESSRYSLIYNGEIYNFKELREELEPSYRFFSQSDTEVILRIFQRDRGSAWKSFNGMFALALYDSLTQELFLARDRAGIKPLYYYLDAETFIFASEIKALLASGLVPHEIDQEALSLYLQFGYFPGESTIYHGIKKLPPGCFARVSPEGLRIEDYRTASKDHTGSAQMADDLDQLLLQSVRHQMISDVPLGAFLSGGIDSSVLVAMMSRFSTSPVKTFTVGFSRMGYYDERAYAAEVAKQFGTEHHEYVVEEGVGEILPSLTSVFDEPFADSSAIPTLCLARLARKHVTVALSGTGGDEIFGGYRKYMAARWARVYTSLPNIVRSTVHTTTSLLPGSRQSLWKERILLLRRFSELAPNQELDLQFNEAFSRNEIQSLLGFSPAKLDFHPASRNLVEYMLEFDYNFYLPDDLLVKEDRCTMAFGLEARVPFLDNLIINFMRCMPIKQKVSATATKILFKKVALRYLPSRIVNRPKHGFGSPIAEWLRSDLKNILLESVGTSRSFLKANEIEVLINDHLHGTADHSKRLWTLLMLELWYKHAR
jgi:asparagine synthase (glutamine-hydrolysing)